MTSVFGLTVILEDRLLTLNAAVGLLRRRNIPVRSVTLGPAAGGGRSRLHAMIEADPETAARVALQFEKLVGVDEARISPLSGSLSRELALVRLSPPSTAYAELLDVLNLYHATVVEEDADSVVVEISGPDSFVLSCLRAVERFRIVDIARSGSVSVARGIDATPPSRETIDP